MQVLQFLQLLLCSALIPHCHALSEASVPSYAGYRQTYPALAPAWRHHPFHRPAPALRPAPVATRFHPVPAVPQPRKPAVLPPAVLTPAPAPAPALSASQASRIAPVIRTDPAQYQTNFVTAPASILPPTAPFTSPTAPILVPASRALPPAVPSLVGEADASQWHAQDELGNHDYGYRNGVSAKHEVGTVGGGVRGSYSWRDQAGTHTVTYIADQHGFRELSRT